jgi:predicted ester cyclase
VDPTTSVIEYTFRGTHHGPLEDLPPSGRAMAVVACSVLESKDGAIQRESDYFDRLALLEQLEVQA